jgi:oligopeptide/dipeptide ABC transporter ATP-binding protein
VLTGLVLAVASLGPLASRAADTTDYSDQVASPSADHWLGTDDAGRDVFSRTVVGTRTSLGAAATVSGLTIVIGLLVGGLAGYVRGPLDAIVSRLIDVLLGLPDLILALAIVGALGVGHGNLMLALTLSGWAPLARVARSLALGSRTRLDVVAARLAGVGRSRAFVGHVLPGMIGQALIVAATGFGTVVLALAGLSFLGLGAQPPTAELGRMLSDSRGDLAHAPWLAIGPCVVIIVTVAAAVLVSDALRDVLDPGADTLPRPLGVRSRHGERFRLRNRGAPWGRSDPCDSQIGELSVVPALELVGLSVTYQDGTRAVRDVDLAVWSGECVALVGESGCGKTTLARTVLQLSPASATVTGDLRVGGTDTVSLDGEGLRRLRGRVVGYVAQDPFAACDPLRSVGHHVAEAWVAQGLRPPADVAERVGELGVDRAGVRLRERPHQWSGGMLQRATIAAAVAHLPTVTVADEPTSALDAVHAEGVLATLRAASESLVLVSHDLGLAATHADRIVVMYAGRVVETGTTVELTARPRHPYTRALLAASPRTGEALSAPLPGDPPSLREGDHKECAFAPRCPEVVARCREEAPVLTDGVACWRSEGALATTSGDTS